jgi:prolyl-tRNA synthetase
MKLSQFFISTLKEAPAEAEVASHKLMLRAGFIKRLSAGIYTYMPMGLRVIRKVEAIVREEMIRAGAVELLMPLVQPAELWQETGRFEKMGPELLRVKDRHDRDFIIQPTSEEVITDIARQELRSYRSLPKNFFHIQTKFRDERRPRFGVMRGREFTMKDAYSFDRDVASAGKSYESMYAAYVRIFERLGLTFRAVAADTGAIGGDRSHEFQVIAETGEDAVVYCPQSNYAANMELAEAVSLIPARASAAVPLSKMATPGCATCEEVATLLGVPLESTVKSLLLARQPEPESADAEVAFFLLLIRGDHSLNEVKVGKLPGLQQGYRFASAAEIVGSVGCKAGSVGPVGVAAAITVIADRTVAAMSDFVCGANDDGFHHVGVNWARDLPEPHLVADIRNVVEGDPSPDGSGSLAIQRGIEVGHVFYLGTKYSEAMGATYLDEGGKPRLMEMGCYGIGITRILGAAVEQSHDDRGMIWPTAIAPFAVVICPIGYDRSEAVRAAADELHGSLEAAGVDAVLDDRGERPGAMFADWELIGVPHRVVIGDRGLKDGVVEYQGRQDSAAATLPLAGLVDCLKAKLAT